jgi:hypothetical protein
VDEAIEKRVSVKSGRGLFRRRRGNYFAADVRGYARGGEAPAVTAKKTTASPISAGWRARSQALLRGMLAARGLKGQLRAAHRRKEGLREPRDVKSAEYALCGPRPRCTQAQCHRARALGNGFELAEGLAAKGQRDERTDGNHNKDRAKENYR